MAFHPTRPDTVYAGTSGVWRSTDGASHLAAGCKRPGGNDLALAVDPVDPANVLAGSASGLFKITLVDCTYTLSPTSKSFTHPGGSGTVAVTVGDSRCTWSAVSTTAWLTVTSGGTGTGTGSVGYAVAANTTTTQRTGTITIAGQTFTVTQDGKPAGPEPIYVPGAAHVAGSAGTNWRTDLEVHNPGATQASYTIALLKRDQDNPAPVEKPYTLGPGLSTRYPDALCEPVLPRRRGHPAGDGHPGAGDGHLPHLQRPARRHLRAVRAGGAGAPWRSARGSRRASCSSPTPPTRSRGSAPTSASSTPRPSPIAVWVDLYRGDGTKLGTRGATLGPFKSIQLNDVFSTVTTSEVPDGFALVRTTTAGGAFFAYASVIDNRSGDPIFIPARVPAP